MATLLAAILLAQPVPPSPDRPVEPCLRAPPPGMSCIPGGPFVRGQDDGPKDRSPASVVVVQTFYMDQTEVTTEAYKACAKAGPCRRAGPWYNDFSRPRQPIVGVSWFDAVRYCEAQGKHLPTEAEWEKAARGPEGHRFPWGNEAATCERAVIKDRRGRGCGTPKKPGRGPPSKGRTLEVATRPAGAYGLYDMAGNAWEWVYDWYSKDGYGACGAACTGSDPRGPCNGESPCRGYRRRVVRGGSWYWPGQHAEGALRRAHIPANKKPFFHHYGFRCAASRAEADRLVTLGSGVP